MEATKKKKKLRYYATLAITDVDVSHSCNIREVLFSRKVVVWKSTEIFSSKNNVSVHFEDIIVL